jgi:hypothetical protein
VMRSVNHLSLLKLYFDCSHWSWAWQRWRFRNSCSSSASC